MVGPGSSYSPLEIHICWNVLFEGRKERPIHTEYLRSGGTTTLFFVEGANAVGSLVTRSLMPGNIVVTPDSTTLAYRSLRVSTSRSMTDWNVVSWILVFLARELKLKEQLWATEALAAQGYGVPVREFVHFLLVGALSGDLHLGVDAERDLAEFFPQRQVQAQDRMRQRVALMCDTCDAPSPEPMTILLVRTEKYREKTAWIATYIAGTLHVSNLTCVMRPRFAFGSTGTSEKTRGCSSGATRSPL
ncbi:unnamed protein product [Prorocentrum cordatum]|uniref:Uncharacterized protein n=1 Tax=Prorocentrum cordatum TaxID=2364126 RepID=A0ABN9RJU3_9DINO|nr:unnamed protein product [Polarella glacialis]